ncbi:MAG: ABC transporter substrate-binding protein [Betaproteobacteria bacterium]|nr:MAG: ABC transporter substrate-binding protein [Betaproteobacteria bacterium]
MAEIERRHFLVAAAALVAAPRLGLAQQRPKVWLIGYIGGGAPGTYFDEFHKGMRDLGYQEGKNVLFERRSAHGDFKRLPAMAADLVNRKVDVIVAATTPAALAVQRATSAIPVVLSLVGDPVASGLVTSLGRPGGNITGLSLANTDIPAKWFELASGVSSGRKIGLLANPKQPTSQWYVRDIQSVAQKLGIEVPVARAATANELEGAFTSLNRERIGTFIVLPSGLFDAHIPQIARLAVQHRMASIGTSAVYAERGMLLSYGQNYNAFSRKTATYVDKILKGANPSELPIEQPMILELAINLVTARQLDLAVPKELISRADRVIE